MKRGNPLPASRSPLALAALLVALMLPLDQALAKSFSSSSGSSSSKSSSSWKGSSSSGSSWGRASSTSWGSGSSSSSSGSDTKPASSSSSSSTTSSGGYSKPSSSSSGASQTVSSGAGKPATSGGGASQTAKPASSGGYAKPVLATPATPAPVSPSSSGAVSPGNTGKGVVLFAPSSSDKQVSRAQSAQTLEQYRKEREQSRVNGVTQSRSKPLFTSYSAGKSYDSDGVWKSRTTYYAKHKSYPQRFQGSRLFDGRRSYGGIDPTFLLSMLFAGAVIPDDFWGAIRGDPESAAFLRDARQYAQEQQDTELLQNLARVESVPTLASGMADDRLASYLRQQDIPPEVVFRSDVLTGRVERPLLRFGSGAEGGVYQKVCAGADEVPGFDDLALDLETRCLPTRGSSDNLDGYAQHEFDAILVQSDLADHWLEGHPGQRLGARQMALYQEPFWLIVNRQSGINSSRDLKPGQHAVYIGAEGSGSAATWRNLMRHARGKPGGERLMGLETRQLDPLQAADRLENDPQAALFLVMGRDGPLLDQIARAFGDALRVIPVDERVFATINDLEGNPVYRPCTVTSDDLPRLTTVPVLATLCVDSLLVLSEGWAERHGAWAESSFVEAAQRIKERLAAPR